MYILKAEEIIASACLVVKVRGPPELYRSYATACHVNAKKFVYMYNLIQLIVYRIWSKYSHTSENQKFYSVGMWAEAYTHYF